MISIGFPISRSTDSAIVPPAKGMVIRGIVDVIANVLVIVTFVAVIDLELVSHDTGTRTAVRVGVLAGALIEVGSGIRVDVLGPVDANIWAASTTALKSMPMLMFREEASCFDEKAGCSCWTTAAWNCRPLQT